MTGNTSSIKQPPSTEIIHEASIETGIPKAFIEKDWYAIQVLEIIGSHSYQGLEPVFSGGTSLSKGYGLIQRFSEDIDFKISTSVQTTRSDRRKYREATIELLRGIDGIEVDMDSIESRDASNVFSFNVIYPQTQTQHDALRPHLQIEMSFHNPILEAETRPLRSFISTLKGDEPDTHIQCVSPVETAADKFSALVWRVLAKDRSHPANKKTNEPAMIRHLHDLSALEKHALSSSDFMRLVALNYEKDKVRGGQAEQHALDKAAQKAHEKLTGDEAYQQEYTQFVESMSYAPDNERIEFTTALASFLKIINKLDQ